MAYYYISSIHRNDLDPKKLCIFFIGYDKNNQVNCYYDLLKRKIIKSRDFSSNEEKFDLKFILSSILLLEENFDIFIFNKNILFDNII